MVKSLISFKSTSSNGCVRVACPLKRSISDQIEATNSLELTALEIENLRMIENPPWWRHGSGNSNVSRALCSSVVLSNGLPKKTTTWSWWSPCSREIFYRILLVLVSWFALSSRGTRRPLGGNYFLGLDMHRFFNLWKSRLERGLEPWPLRCWCSAPPVELSADWELVVMPVDCKPVDAEIYIHLMLIIKVIYLNYLLKRSLKCVMLAIFFNAAY